MDLSELLASGAILVVAWVAGSNYLRARRSGDLDVFLAFAPYAVVGALGLAPGGYEAVLAAPRLGLVLMALLYVQPVLFARLVRNVGKAPGVPMVAATVGGLVSLAVLIQEPTLLAIEPGQQPDLSGPAMLAIIVGSIGAFLVPNAWVGVQFARAAARSAGVAKVRLAWASTAAFLFIVSLMTYSLPATSPVAVVSDLVNIAVAAAFLLGFAPPRWVQRAWRANAYVRFHQACRGIPADASDAEFDRRLLAGTRGVLDADAIRFSPTASGHAGEVSAPTGDTGHRAYLVATFRGPRLFPEEDRMALAALAGQCFQLAEPRERLRHEAEARKAAEEQASFKASFLRHFGHEVANPLSPIRLQASLLVKHATPDQVKRLDIIQRNVQRLDEIIEDVSGVAKAIDPRAPREIADVDVAQVLRDAMATYRDTAAKAGCTLEFDGDGATTVKADRSRLAQVFDNLYSNAIKYSPAGGPIRISANASDGGVLVRFQDAGLGFDAAQGERVFRTYSRVHREVAPGIPGSGLGLYLVQEVAHAHGGWAKAESAGPGQGSTFMVWLPPVPPSAPHEATFRF